MSTLPATHDLQAIAATIQDYFEGMYYRDTARLRKAFHPAACLFGHYKGTFAHIPLEDWLKAVEGRPIPAESGEAFDMRIVATDITGQVGMVKVADLYRGLRFTDYLGVARLDGQWVIVNKIFHHD
jgi:Putative lumazine-binding